MIAARTSAAPVAPDQTGRRLDLQRRLIEAGLADPAVWQGVPPDALLYLLPDDDPAFAEGEISAGLAAVRRGQDVYFRHVRTADLPALPPVPSEPVAGDRHVTYDAAGALVTNLVFGSDGRWHPTDDPPPGPRDDDPSELFPSPGDGSPHVSNDGSNQRTGDRS